MANTFVHNELNTQDVGKAKEFYGKLFDWKLEDMPGSPGNTYTLISSGDKSIGGIMQHPMPGAPSLWISYVLVDDIHAATAKAKSLGATAIKEAQEVPKMGWFSILLDPTGACFAIWQANG